MIIQDLRYSFVVMLLQFLFFYSFDLLICMKCRVAKVPSTFLSLTSIMWAWKFI